MHIPNNAYSKQLIIVVLICVGLIAVRIFDIFDSVSLEREDPQERERVGEHSRINFEK